jgi:DNA-binding NtrC family response regulator
MSVLKTMKRRWPEGEVIVVTGYPSVDTAKEAIRLGACDYLAKPLAPGEVIEAANNAIERKHWTLRREGERAWQVNGSNDGAARAPGNAG